LIGSLWRTYASNITGDENLSQEQKSSLLTELYELHGVEFFSELLISFPGVDRPAYTVDEVRAYGADDSTWKSERLLTRAGLATFLNISNANSVMIEFV
jgi:hypothetical protein